jgi:hypothetical protein
VNLAQAGGRETERLSLCAPNRLWISSIIHLEAEWDAPLDSLKKNGIIPTYGGDHGNDPSNGYNG